MGVTIHYTLGQETGKVAAMLDYAQNVAETIKREQAEKVGVSMIVDRRSDTALYVDIDGCETVAFDFKRHGETWSGWRAEYGKGYIPFDNNPETSDHYKRWPDQITLWASGFCKTQFGESVACHIWVAEVIRAAAGMAAVAHVYDEGDYYHNRDGKMAKDAIAEVGAVIESLAGTMKAKGFDVVQPNKTKIKK